MNFVAKGNRKEKYKSHIFQNKQLADCFLKFKKMGKRRRGEEKPKAEGEYDLPPKHLKAVHVEPNKKRLIVILHGAQLETVKVSSESS